MNTGGQVNSSSYNQPQPDKGKDKENLEQIATTVVSFYNDSKVLNYKQTLSKGNRRNGLTVFDQNFIPEDLNSIPGRLDLTRLLHNADSYYTSNHLSSRLNYQVSESKRHLDILQKDCKIIDKSLKDNPSDASLIEDKNNINKQIENTKAKIEQFKVSLNNPEMLRANVARKAFKILSSRRAYAIDLYKMIYQQLNKFSITNPPVNGPVKREISRRGCCDDDPADDPESDHYVAPKLGHYTPPQNHNQYSDRDRFKRTDNYIEDNKLNNYSKSNDRYSSNYSKINDRYSSNYASYSNDKSNDGPTDQTNNLKPGKYIPLHMRNQSTNTSEKNIKTNNSFSSLGEMESPTKILDNDFPALSAPAEDNSNKIKSSWAKGATSKILTPMTEEEILLQKQLANELKKKQMFEIANKNNNKDKNNKPLHKYSHDSEEYEDYEDYEEDDIDGDDIYSGQQY
jgi:hypothetical protein